MKTGKCGGCEKEGIISVTDEDGEWPFDNIEMLTCYGGNLFCCNDECYAKARSKDV